MARTKFLLFALLGLALALAGLAHLSSRLAGLSAVQTTERLAWGKTLFESSGRLAQAWRTAAMGRAAAEATTKQAFEALNSGGPVSNQAGAAEAVWKAATRALSSLPAGAGSPQLVILEAGGGFTAIDAEGGQAKALDGDVFGLATAGAGPDGGFAQVDGRLYRVVSVPVHAGDAGGALLLGRIGAAFLLDEAFVAETARDLTLGVTLVAGESTLSSLPEASRKAAASASGGAVQLQPRPTLGPVTLPILAGPAPLAQALSFELPAGGARVVLTAESATLRELVQLQERFLLGLAGLVTLALSFFFLIGSGRAAAQSSAEEAPASGGHHEPVPAAEPYSMGAPSTFGSDALESLSAGDNAAEALESSRPDARSEFDPFPSAPAAGANPDSFDPFPSAPGPSAGPDSFDPFPPATTTAGDFEPFVSVPRAADPFEAFGQPPSPTYPQPADAIALPAPGEVDSAGAADPFSFAGDHSHRHEETTGNYAAIDPFALASAQLDPAESQQYHEATVVAAVPQQLLRATARMPATGMAEAIALPAPVAETPVDPDEVHFLEVFEQFLAVRTQCNEPNDASLTAEKFVAKLRKNREQLVQKHNCRTVRFQVHVKEGKAALKVTPVRS